MAAFSVFSELKHTSILETVVSDSSRSLTYGKKLKQFGTHHLLLTVSGDLFVGVFQTEQKLIDFRFLRTDVADFDVSDKSVYVISNQDGKVYEGSGNPFCEWQQVCEEGQTRFEHICIKQNEVILVSEGGADVYIFNEDLRLLIFQDGTVIKNTVAVTSGSSFVTLLNRNSDTVMADFKKSSFMYRNRTRNADFERYLNWKNIYQHPTCCSGDSQQPSEFEATISSIVPYGHMLHETEMASFGKHKPLFNVYIQPENVSDLKLVNITKITSGSDHLVILTADGKLYLNKNPLSNSASPELLLPGMHVLDVACGKSRTYVVTNDLKIYDASSNDNYLNYDDNTYTMEKDRLKDLDLDEVPMILASDQLILVNRLPINKNFQSSYAMLCKIIPILSEKISSQCNEEREFSEEELNNLEVMNSIALVEQFKQSCKHLYYLLILNVKSVRKFLLEGDASAILAVKMHKELIHQYQEMLTNFCNAISSGMVSFEQSTFEMFDVFRENLKSISLLVDDLSLPGMQEIWQKLNDMVAEETELAISTRSFWSDQKNEAWLSLKEPQRRVVLDSARIPLKKSSSIFFSTASRMVLFSDVIVYIGDSGLVKYPLELVWLSTKGKSNKIFKPKYRLLVSLYTPDEVIHRYALKMEDKEIWVDKLSQYIRQNAMFRSGSYLFREGHEKYGGMTYEGFWKLGVIEGFGKLQGRNWNYEGELYRGEISGYGRISRTETDCVKEYKGDFIAGKFHGYGVLKVTTPTMHWKYEGYFKNDEFDGFGSFEKGNYCYRGGFTKGLKQGFGVLVDNDAENHRVKYMGMFLDDKMNGKGTMVINDTTSIDMDWCIVGQFEDDKLHNTEQGVAIFRDGRSYEGALAFEGPLGNGTFFQPVNDSKKMATDPNSTEVIGYGLSGCFGGTWKEVIVTSGKLERSEKKSPVLRLKDHIPARNIWASVFNSFAENVFGTDNMEELPGSELWNKIAIYMARAKRKQQLEKDCFELNFSDFDQESIARFCQYGHELTLPSQTAGVVQRAPEESPKDAVDLDNISIISAMSINSGDENEFIIYPQLHSTLSDVMDVVPEFGWNKIDDKDWGKLQEYLSDAFQSQVHPLYHLYDVLVNCFFGTYSQPEKDSFLCEVAKQELIAMVDRIYTSFIVRMFPALPALSYRYEGMPEDPKPLQLMYPIVLTDTIYLTLLQLYVHQYRELDELYQQRMLFFKGRTDEFIMQHVQYEEADMLQNINFKQAVDLFTSIKEKRTPCKTMDRIRQVFDLLNTTLVEHKKDGADALMPLTEILVVKANIPQFGAEISTLTGLMTFDGNNEYIITTLQAMYKHLLNVNLF